MKKLYSTIMMLAIMGAALSFTACSSCSDDDDFGGGEDRYTSSDFTITYDGEEHSVELAEWINPIFGNGGYKKGNYFCLDNYPLNNGQIHIIFPYSKYGENVQPSFFPVGYSDFDEDATDIEFISAEFTGWDGEYTSGSAKVVKNNGKYITIKFSNYKFEVRRNGKSHKFILNGTLDFLCYLYE